MDGGAFSTWRPAIYGSALSISRDTGAGGVSAWGDATDHDCHIWGGEPAQIHGLSVRLQATASAAATSRGLPY
eukprot:7116593-Prymnesium_polylepis.1